MYQYHFLDDLRFIGKLHEILRDEGSEHVERLSTAVADLLRSKGWEGDGELGILWLPPFADCGVEDTWGTYVWHVKQSNNGTSWLASPAPLEFGRLQEQNENRPWETHVLLGALFSECTCLARDGGTAVGDVKNKVDALRGAGLGVGDGIAADLLLAAQGKLVALFQEFLDDCYLQLLRHVFEHGNPGRLKLSRFKATLNPGDHMINEDDYGPIDEEGRKWFTTVGLITDIWRSYRFEPFAEKVSMLFRPLDFVPSNDSDRLIRKHVELRNCMQHHGGQLTPDALRRLGLSEVELKSDGGAPNRKLGPWKPVEFSVAELQDLCAAMVDLARTLEPHARTRLRSSIWVPRDEAHASPLIDLYPPAAKKL